MPQHSTDQSIKEFSNSLEASSQEHLGNRRGCMFGLMLTNTKLAASFVFDIRASKIRSPNKEFCICFKYYGAERVQGQSYVYAMTELSDQGFMPNCACQSHTSPRGLQYSFNKGNLYYLVSP